MGLSWSKIRKMLEEDFLCEKLRGRVQYFFTLYHGAPDDYGRFAIRVDDQEIFQANPYNEYHFWHKNVEKLREEQQVPRRQWEEDTDELLFDEENSAIEDAADLLTIEEGHATTWLVMRSIKEYLNMQPEDALQSKNLLLRMLAVVDRRVGKRTLVKLADTYGILPQWLQTIYKVRFEVEGISVKNRQNLMLSADGDISLFEVDEEVLRQFEELLATFSHGHCYDEQDFVKHIQEKCGDAAIRFQRIVGCYPDFEPEYKHVKWYNF